MIGNFQQDKILYEGKNSLIYHQDESSWDTPVVVKVLSKQYPTPQQITQFNNELEFTQSLNIKGIRRVFASEKHQGKHCLVMEFVEGDTLKSFFTTHQPDLRLFLQTAIQVAHTLGEIHNHQIIHKDINANNVLIDSKTHQTTIIDFGISSRINLKTTHLENPDRLEGTLSYISPEQTGRMNRVVDYRTDLYSLGVTFYELLTFELPFYSNDSLELIHAHIAQEPLPPSVINPAIPQVVSDIVMKLLHKNAEDRYQSAFGLAHDLEQCLEQLDNEGQITPFEIAQKDFSGNFQIPEKLYGRDEEVNKILNAFQRACDGKKELLLVQWGLSK